MPKLPIISSRDVIKALAKVGFKTDHQTGSHIILRRSEHPYQRLTVPNHKEIARGTLKSIIEESGLSVEEFINLL